MRNPPIDTIAVAEYENGPWATVERGADRRDYHISIFRLQWLAEFCCTRADKGFGKVRPSLGYRVGWVYEEFPSLLWPVSTVPIPAPA